MKDKYPYFIVLMDSGLGLATVSRTNKPPEAEHEFENGTEAVLYAKRLMDDWMADSLARDWAQGWEEAKRKHEEIERLGDEDDE